MQSATVWPPPPPSTRSIRRHLPWAVRPVCRVGKTTLGDRGRGGGRHPFSPPEAVPKDEEVAHRLSLGSPQSLSSVRTIRYGSKTVSPLCMPTAAQKTSSSSSASSVATNASGGVGRPAASIPTPKE